MAEIIVMPKLGLTMTEGNLSNWRKAEGDRIEQGDILFDVETDKLSNEIEAKVSGVLRKILVRDGEVEVLRPVAIVGTEDEDISALLAEAGGSVPQAGTGELNRPEGAEAGTPRSLMRSKRRRWKAESKLRRSPKKRRPNLARI